MGPGMTPGTGFAVVGIGFSATVVRYGETQGGSGGTQPAAVVSLVVPPDAPPGLYSIVAVRGFQMATFSGGIEVTTRPRRARNGGGPRVFVARSRPSPSSSRRQRALRTRSRSRR